MFLYWLVCSTDDDIAVVVLPASALVYARFDAARKNRDDGTFVEGHQLDAKLSKRVPKKMIDRRLSQDEATKLLAKFE
jgi:hypothetical protein